MSAPTATLEAGTPRTSDTATVEPVTSSQAMRIDSFIASKFAEVASERGSGIIHSGARARELGFGSSANSQYADFLAAFQVAPHLRHRYGSTYPDCVFLPWSAFHAVRKSLKLWCDLPRFYVGGIPDSQLDYMERFALERDGDEAGYIDLVDLLEIKGDEPRRTIQQRLIIASGHSDEPRRRFIVEGLQSLFVLAPPGAFSTSGDDWIERFRKGVAQPQMETKPVPPDPLVVRFVNGGVLVVASWGDEAEWLNEAMRRVNGVDSPVG